MGRASRERKLRRQRQLANEALLARVRREWGANSQVAPPGTSMLPPLSRQVTELISPERDLAPHLDAEKALVSLGVLAWNLAQLPDGLEQVAKDRPEIARNPVLLDLLRALISRKLALFPDDHRFILDYEITEFDDGPHLTVVSTNLAGPPQPPPG